MAEETRNSPPAPAPRHHDPFGSFRSEMERLFDTFSGGNFPSFPSVFGSESPAGNGLVAPDIDIRENDKEIVIEAELPGIEEKDISVTMQHGFLTLKGEKKFEHDEEKDDYHRIERRYGSFRRSMRLPDTINENDIVAKFDKGVLTVTLPKRPEAVSKERKIEIAAS